MPTPHNRDQLRSYIRAFVRAGRAYEVAHLLAEELHKKSDELSSISMFSASQRISEVADHLAERGI